MGWSCSSTECINKEWIKRSLIVAKKDKKRKGIGKKKEKIAFKERWSKY